MRDEVLDGLITGYIDKEHTSNLAFQPRFLSNDYKKGEKVISAIEAELLNCDEFIFSVAFIAESGLAPLRQTLKMLEEKGIKGKILTTDYLTFSDPKALRELDGFSNIEVRMYLKEGSRGFHTKGYIFHQTAQKNILLGAPILHKVH